MQPTGFVGPVPKIANGATNVQFTQDNQGNQLFSEYHARYYNAAYQGNLFSVANQAAVTTSSTLNTTFTGLSLANPATSGVNLVLLQFYCAQFAVGAAAVVSIAGGSGVAAGSLTVRNALVGTSAKTATIASASATITAPILLRPVGSVGSLATTGYGLSQSIVADLGGSIIVPPGNIVCSDTSVATTSALIFGFLWQEIPV